MLGPVDGYIVVCGAKQFGSGKTGGPHREYNGQMDSFNADDFWTNGEFQNLYATGDGYDQYSSRDLHIEANWFHPDAHSEMFGALFQHTAIDQFSVTPSYSNDLQLDDYCPEQNYQPYDSHQMAYTAYDQAQIAHSTSFEDTSTQIFLTDMDEWKQKNLNEIMYQADANNNNAWESNIDDLLFDSSCDTVSYTGDLPARTLYCNDSCTSFLAEATENLQTYRPPLDAAQSQYTSASCGASSDMGQAKVVRKQCAPHEDKEFVCTYGDCRKVYAKAGHLKAHIRRHIGDKPYVCHWPNCTWRFSRSDELSRHRRSHSGIKPYKCSYCPKCFSRSDHLTKHRKVHERKMAALKIKAVWNQLPPRKPGRKPKSAVAKSIADEL